MEATMPYFVEPAVLPSVTTAPNGAPSPQLQQFANQLSANLNAIEQQRGFHLDQILGVGSAALLIFKQ
jgi:hypothetical protein